MIAILDNHDSFTYNLVYLLQTLAQEVRVYEEWDEGFAEASHIILSPGPKHPKDSPLNQRILSTFLESKPILGVCLGHQCIAYAFGAEVGRAREPVHGKSEAMHFVEGGIFEGMEQGTKMMRYHSLVVKKLPPELEAIAWNHEGMIMALRHRDLPVFGVQFHPESTLSQQGEILLSNFISCKSQNSLSR